MNSNTSHTSNTNHTSSYITPGECRPEAGRDPEHRLRPDADRMIHGCNGDSEQ